MNLLLSYYGILEYLCRFHRCSNYAMLCCVVHYLFFPPHVHVCVSLCLHLSFSRMKYLCKNAKIRFHHSSISLFPVLYSNGLMTVTIFLSTESYKKLFHCWNVFQPILNHCLIQEMFFLVSCIVIPFPILVSMSKIEMHTITIAMVTCSLFIFYWKMERPGKKMNNAKERK